MNSLLRRYMSFNRLIEINFELCTNYPYKNVYDEIVNALYVLPKLE